MNINDIATRKNKKTGYTDALTEIEIIDGGYDHEADKTVCCGRCKAKQPIFITSKTLFVEELDFICNKCGERNTLSAY